jgi:hypothetical protein
VAALPALDQAESDRLGIGVEHGADGFRHARRLSGSQRARDGVGELGVNGLEVSRHEVMGNRAIGGFARGRELHAHFDKERARRHGPEGSALPPSLGISAAAAEM